MPSLGHPWPATPILAGHQGALHAHDRVPSAAGDQSTGAAGANTSRPPAAIAERRCPMARLRTMLVTLAVAALLLVATATTALAGLTATAVD